MKIFYMKKEMYYIKKYNTYVDGYNSSIGGLIPYNSKLKREDVFEIRQLLKETDISMVDISKKYKVNSSSISDINCGDIWYDSDIEYPIRPMSWNKPINFFR